MYPSPRGLQTPGGPAPVGALPWGNTNRVVSNRVVSKGPLYPLQNQNYYVIWNCASLWYTPCILNMSGAGFATNSQIWFLGTTPLDTTPFICL